MFGVIRIRYENLYFSEPLYHSPPSLLQLCTRIIVHAQTAAQQQANGSYEARMSRKCGEWRD